MFEFYFAIYDSETNTEIGQEKLSANCGTVAVLLAEEYCEKNSLECGDVWYDDGDTLCIYSRKNDGKIYCRNSFWRTADCIEEEV